MTIDQRTIKRRMAARELARSIVRQIVEDAGRVPADARDQFWEEFHKVLPQTASRINARPVEPFTDQQAKEFGRRAMPFGKYSGMSVDEVPIEHLEFLSEPSPFILSLRRYLASNRVAVEQQEAGE